MPRSAQGQRGKPYVQQHMDLPETRNSKRLLKLFYEDIIDFYRGRLPIVSPAIYPEWAASTADWLLTGDAILEVGCGDGWFSSILVSKLAALQDARTRRVLITDFAPHVLEVAQNRVSKMVSGNKQLADSISFDLVDLECLSTYKSAASFRPDRLAAINVFGDTDVAKSLSQVRRTLSPGGMFVGTFYSKETYDDFWGGEANASYDSESGTWFTPLDFYDHSDDLESMGTFVRPQEQGGTLQLPYIRIQRYNTGPGWCDMVENAGFEIMQKPERIYYPADMVRTNWRRNLSRRQVQLLAKWGGFPEVWEIKATRPYDTPH